MAESAIKFNNWRFSRIRRFCNKGTREKKSYQPIYDRAGVWHLEEMDTKIQTYMEIQSYKDECDINLIMARYRNGETDVLSKVQGVYGDFMNVPNDFAQVLNDTIKMEQVFMSLSPEVREKFNNSFEQFGAALGTKEWQDIMFPPKAEASPAESSVEFVKEGASE